MEERDKQTNKHLYKQQKTARRGLEEKHQVRFEIWPSFRKTKHWSSVRKRVRARRPRRQQDDKLRGAAQVKGRTQTARQRRTLETDFDRQAGECERERERQRQWEAVQREASSVEAAFLKFGPKV